MKKVWYMAAAMILSAQIPARAQVPLTPEKLWELGRVSAETLTPDGKYLIYGVSRFDLTNNNSERNLYRVPVAGGQAEQITFARGGESVVHVDASGNNLIYLHGGQLWTLDLNSRESRQLTQVEGGLQNVKFSPDKKHILFSRAVPLENLHSSDKYKDLPKSDAYIYEQLDYRHWDTWNDGKYHHVFVAGYEDGKIGEPKDIMENEPYHTPQQPFGGGEDMVWSPDGKSILYVSKKKHGTAYALSTNTDIYKYELQSGQTTNLTEGMQGYDTHPVFSPDGQGLAWLSMAEDGYEADKNDIIVLDKTKRQRYNLTKDWDGTVNDYRWSNDGRKIWFVAAVRGTIQLFEINLSVGLDKVGPGQIRQISSGEHDLGSIVGQSGDQLVVSRNTINRASEVYRFDLGSRSLTPVTQVNDGLYAGIATSEVKARVTKSSDGKDLFSWVVYPPGFDPSKKYPTLLYCQGGPQSALTQFYSFRWNLQLIAAQGYIVVAPNRRGMPGHGVEWNEQISGDWGGQPIRDYLAAIDDVAKESYVDKDRLGAIGASYGGYSVFMLAGVHQNRFKTFIAHDGLFDMRSWYGTTEELFFANKDLGGPYWDPKNKKTYTDFNPIEHIDKWNTPIFIIQGGKDFRVGIEQGLEAFQAAQLKGIKSKLLYLPDENHWVTTAQNALVWQREFFSWLKETL